MPKVSRKDKLQKQIEELEVQMNAPDFWNDKDEAQRVIKEIQDLKAELEGGSKYDKGSAVMTIFAGAGGVDAEDFARMLLEMYVKYIENKGWKWGLVHKNENDHAGYRNVTIEIKGKNVYGELKRESGVHRLVRVSPFNANKQRHTAFAMVEVVPELEKVRDINIPEEDLEVEFARSSGPGGQNVNKRETAVRVVHKPTGLSVHSEAGRSQAQNKEKAMAILQGKIFKKKEEDREKKGQGLAISKTTKVEWGNQIRSYVLHPYKMVKDHRTKVEVSDVESVLDGDLQEFIDAEKAL